MRPIRMLRLPAVLDITGDRRTTLHYKIKDGLFPPPVKITSHNNGWPDYEAETLARARIAGRTDEEIRELVKRMVADRLTVDQPSSV